MVITRSGDQKPVLKHIITYHYRIVLPLSPCLSAFTLRVAQVWIRFARAAVLNAPAVAPASASTSQGTRAELRREAVPARQNDRRPAHAGTLLLHLRDGGATDGRAASASPAHAMRMPCARYAHATHPYAHPYAHGIHTLSTPRRTRRRCSSVPRASAACCGRTSRRQRRCRPPRSRATPTPTPTP